MSLAAEITNALANELAGYRQKYADITPGLSPKEFDVWYTRHEDNLANTGALIATRGDDFPLVAGLKSLSPTFSPSVHWAKLIDEALPVAVDYTLEVDGRSHDPRGEAKLKVTNQSLARLGGPETLAAKLIAALMADTVAIFQRERDAALQRAEQAEQSMRDEKIAIRNALTVLEAHAAKRPSRKPKPEPAAA